jgi:hypothetical protein
LQRPNVIREPKFVLPMITEIEGLGTRQVCARNWLRFRRTIGTRPSYPALNGSEPFRRLILMARESQLSYDSFTRETDSIRIGAIMRLCMLFAIFASHLASAQPRPLNQISQGSAIPRISILEIRIQELKFGHEGPGYFDVDRGFFRGELEVVEAALFGQEAIATVRFELVSGSGQVLSTVPAFRIGDGADAHQYYLQLEAPAQAFRFRIEGLDSQGRPYSSLFPRLFEPAQGSAAKPELPAGLSEDQARRVRTSMAEAAERTLAQFASARKAYPDGTVRIGGWNLSAATYEPLVSPSGNPLGVRVRFQVRFESAGYFALSPYVFPLYANSRWRGNVAMKVLDAAVDPAVAGGGAQDALRYGGAAHYETDTVYRFTFDLVPDYVIRNEAGTRYCLNLQGFRNRARQPVWEEIRASEAPVKYRVDISSLNFFSETAPMSPQRAYYEGFLREGAKDCGPTPTTHF